MTSLIATVTLATASTSRNVTRLAQTEADLLQAHALRYQVFNVELGEGLAESAALGLDMDRYDAACDHLLVIDTTTDTVVGTYRCKLASERSSATATAANANLT